MGDPGPGLADLAVVGGGVVALSALRELAALLLARLGAGSGAHLHPVEQAGRCVSIVLVSADGACGRGLAYRTSDPGHLLNVRAGRMGIDRGNPGGFLDWLHRTGHPVRADDFVPRSLYGAYLDGLWQELPDQLRACGAHLRRIDGLATGIDAGAGPVAVQLTDGRTVRARAALVCTGPPPVVPLAPDGPAWIGEVWPDPAKRLQALRGEVAVVGTGLSAVDVASTLLETPGVVRVTMVSHTGQLPLAQVEHAAQGACSDGPAAAMFPACSPLVLLRAVRACSRTTRWQDAVDEVRCQLPGIWQDWSVQQRHQALRHLGPVWATHRHRCPQSVLDRLESARTAGRLRLERRVVGSVVAGQGGVVLEGPGWSLKADAGVDARAVGRVTGRAEPLVDRAVRDGLFRIAPTGFGIAADPWHRASPPGAAPVFVVGASRLGDLAESTGVVELREHAATAAAAIADVLLPGQGGARL
jgi:uncharacterized NAD(P)/FAD-binding protein YdhS